MASYTQFNDVSNNLPIVSCNGITFDLSGSYLYLVNFNSPTSTIDKLDTSGNITQVTVPITGSLQDLTFDASGTTLYASNYNDGFIYTTVPSSGGNSLFTKFSTSVISGPEGLVFDNYGNLYCASSGGSGGNSIYKITTDGSVNFFTNGSTPGSDTSLNYPFGLIFDNEKQYLYCSNYNGNSIVKIDASSGDVTMFANNITNDYGSNASFNRPMGLVFDYDDNLYCANNGTYNGILIINTNGTVTNFTPLSTSSGSSARGIAIQNNFLYFSVSQGRVYKTDDAIIVNSPLTYSQFNQQSETILLKNIQGMTFDASKNYIYMCNTNNEENKIIRFDMSGNPSKYAPTLDTSNNLTLCQDVTFDTSGTLYVSNYTTSPATISQIDALGNVTTYVYSNDLSYPEGLEFDLSNVLYCANANGTSSIHVNPGWIAKITNDNGTINTSKWAYGNTPDSDISLNYPIGIAFDNKYEYLYCSNYYNYTDPNQNHGYIVKIDASANVKFFTNGSTPGSDTSLNNPIGLVFDSYGYLYCANNNTSGSIDGYNIVQIDIYGVVKKFINVTLNNIEVGPRSLVIKNNVLYFNGNTLTLDSSGIVFKTNSAVVSSPIYSQFNQQSETILLKNIQGMTFDASKNYIYMCNTNNEENKIIRFDMSGNPSKYAPTTGSEYLTICQDIAFDASGTLYVSNYTSPGTISQIDALGNVTPYVSSFLSYPEGLEFDLSNVLYCVNANATSISKGNPGWITKTINNSGTINTSIWADGSTPDSDISLNYPIGIAFDNKYEYLYCSNYYNYTDPNQNHGYIVKIDASANVKFFTNGSTPGSDTSLNNPIGLVFDSYGYLYCANNNTSGSIDGYNIVQIDIYGVVKKFINVTLNNIEVGPRSLVIKNNVLYFNGNTITTDSSGIVFKTNSTVCFNDDTKILCLNSLNLEDEYIPIQDLKKGYLVKTYLHGYHKIEYIYQSFIVNNPNQWDHCMYKMEKTEENGLLEDLILTGGHSIMVDSISEVEQERYNKLGLSNFAKENKVDEKYLLLASVSEQFIPLTDTNIYTIYHFCLENNGDDTKRYGVWANGILTETPSKQYLVEHL